MTEGRRPPSGWRSPVTWIVCGATVAASAWQWITGTGYLPTLLVGAWQTVQVAVIASLIAAIVAVLAAVCRMFGPRWLRWAAVAFVETFRGTSVLVQLFWLYFVLPLLGVSLPTFVVAVAGLGLNTGAYGSEIIRGAVKAVSPGQWEAGRALNLTESRIFLRVILPQAWPMMIPPWGNLLIELLKATALVSLITLSDLSFTAQRLNQTTLHTGEIFSGTLLIYLALALLISSATHRLELAASRGDTGANA